MASNMQWASEIPPDLIRFLFVTFFSLLIGIEQREHHQDTKGNLFGTDRTFALIGILGFILYILSPESLTPFFIGGAGIVLFLGIYYHNRIRLDKKFGITSIVIALITYCLAPLIYSQPIWMSLLVGVSVLILTEIKDDLLVFSKKFDRNDFLTLSKFIIIAGIILPLLSNEPVWATYHFSPYRLWVTVVAVSSISYVSYLIRKFIFPDAGILLTALIGGLYSSTATTIILARKNKKQKEPGQTTAGIIAATGMMYFRLLLLAFLFNQAIALKLLPGFGILTVLTLMLSWYFWQTDKHKEERKASYPHQYKNPLELKTAVIFGFLFAFFGVITQFVARNYGDLGVTLLSFIVGVTDIDPYILNLFQGVNAMISFDHIIRATMIATASNNLIKMVYAICLGTSSMRRQVIAGFSILIVSSLALTFYFY
jgi:uncharacterized membrane protein (DUF4010 family)